MPENQSMPIRIATDSVGRPSVAAKNVYVTTMPPGTTIVPMHIRNARRIVIANWEGDSVMPVAWLMNRIAST